VSRPVKRLVISCIGPDVLSGERLCSVKDVKLILLKFETNVYIDYAIWASINPGAIVNTHTSRYKSRGMTSGMRCAARHLNTISDVD
jgi:hypothetical protein